MFLPSRTITTSLMNFLHIHQIVLWKLVGIHRICMQDSKLANFYLLEISRDKFML